MRGKKKRDDGGKDEFIPIVLVTEANGNPASIRFAET
jgi:rRNA maturation protein Rpf1